MNENQLRYLPFVAEERNLLLFSDKSFEEFNDMFNSFNSFLSNEITTFTIEHLNNTINENNIDVVLLYSSNNLEQIRQSVQIIRDAKDDVTIVLILAAPCYQKSFYILNLVDIVMAEPISDEILANKLFTSLSNNCAVKALGNKESSLRHNVNISRKEDLESFLDTYEGEILFLSEELKTIVKSLDFGDLSKELLDDAARKMDEVSAVFAYHSYTKYVAPIFSDLALYLHNLKLENIAVENIEGFEYLARIIDDIDSYIMEYFVDRSFLDVYVFEHSLENSIKFMQDRLEAANEDDSELDFF